MATKLALFLVAAFMFFAAAAACGHNCPRPSPPPPSPCPPPPPSGSGGSGGSGGSCPIDTLKLAACANVLNGLIDITIGTPPKEPCCTLLSGLVDLEAALCLCTAIKANILGINLNIPIDLSLLVNYCGKHVPKGFQCA